MSQKIMIVGSYNEPAIGVTCPKCSWVGDVSLQRFVLAVNHCEEWKCLDCGYEFRLEFVGLTRVVEQRDEAVDVGQDLTCTCDKVKFYPWENVTDENCPIHGVKS